MLFTRWHQDDLAGRILDPNNEHYDPEEAKEWTVIAIPALKEETKPLECAIDIGDPRDIDEALWPERHAAEKYFKRRRMSPLGFASLDQQRPTAEGGNIIKEDWFPIIDAKELPFSPEFHFCNYWIDGAYTEKVENDPSAILAEKYHNGTLYLFQVEAKRLEMNEFLPYFKTFTRLNYYDPRSTVWIEPKASGLSLKSMLRQPQYGAFNVRSINSKLVSDGKLSRAQSAAPFIASGKVVLVKGSWNKQFIQEVTAFPNGTHDDMLDLLCYSTLEYFVKQERSSGGVSYSR
jgi:predicted phage terminase large subunit-like protein